VLIFLGLATDHANAPSPLICGLLIIRYELFNVLPSSPVLCWCRVPRGPLSLQCPAKALGIWLAIYCEYIIGYKWHIIGYKWRTWSVRPVPPA
jgi:hypothetical protein